MSTRPGTINRIARTIVDYAPDPRGIGFFGALSAVHQDGIEGQEGEVYLGDHGSGGHAFHGYAQAPQLFGGAAALALNGAVRPVHPNVAMLDSARSDSSLNDLDLRIFASRARRAAVGE